MKIYEMILAEGGESFCSFFLENNIASRQYFIQLARQEIDRELNDFKLSCTGGEDYDLTNFFEEIYRESHFYIDVMEENFINFSYAQFSKEISLRVVEREVVKLGF